MRLQDAETTEKNKLSGQVRAAAVKVAEGDYVDVVCTAALALLASEHGVGMTADTAVDAVVSQMGG